MQKYRLHYGYDNKKLNELEVNRGITTHQTGQIFCPFCSSFPRICPI